MSDAFFVKVRKVGGSLVIPVTKTDMEEDDQFVMRWERVSNGYRMSLEAVD